jgi:hypothetical protein
MLMGALTDVLPEPDSQFHCWRWNVSNEAPDSLPYPAAHPLHRTRPAAACHREPSSRGSKRRSGWD